jgi:hypothetical protein
VLQDYEELDGVQTDGERALMVHKDVSSFLEGEKRNSRRHVVKIYQILKRLKDNGQRAVNNTEQFVREGSFPSGIAGGSDEVVYAVKAFQLRVYGGFRRLKGKSIFFCIEAAKKKKDKADREQLKRVARKLGRIDG